MSRSTSPSSQRREGGFTLVEIMVVVAIVAMSVRIVTANLGALVPSTVLDAEASKLISTIEYLRSEAQLQSKSYKLEFDLQNGRWRLVMPPEERLVSTQTVGEEIPLQWKYLDERCKFAGFHTLSGHTAQSGVSKLVIDENGYTTDSMIYLQMVSESLDYNIWTVHVYGLEQRARLLTNVKKEFPRLEIVDEGAFQ